MRFWSRSSCCAVRIRGTRGSERGFVCRFCNCSLRLAIAEHFVVLCRDRSCRKGYLKTCEIAMFASPVSAGHGRRVLACLLCKDSLRLVIECAMPCSAEVRDASGVIEERRCATLAISVSKRPSRRIYRVSTRLRLQARSSGERVIVPNLRLRSHEGALGEIWNALLRWRCKTSHADSWTPLVAEVTHCNLGVC